MEIKEVIFMANNSRATITDTTITVENMWSKNTFELVDKVPLGYSVWPIGKNMAPGYLPLCRIDHFHQPFEGARRIDPTTLKAIRVDGAEYVLAAAIRGHGTLKKVRRYINRHKNTTTDCVRRRVEIYQKAVPVMEMVGL